MADGRKVYFIAEPRHATAIIATWLIISNVASGLSFAAFICLQKEVGDQVVKTFSKYNDEEHTVKTQIEILVSFAALIYAFMALELLINLMLLFGAIKSRRMFLLPWLIMTATWLFPCLLIPFSAFILPGVLTKIFAFMLLSLIMGHAMYIWLTVLFCYKRLNLNTQNPSVQVTKNYKV